MMTEQREKTPERSSADVSRDDARVVASLDDLRDAIASATNLGDDTDREWIWLQAEDDVVERGSTPNEVYERFVIEGRCGWKHRTFDAVARYQREFDDYIAKPPDVEAGVFTCVRCGSDRVYSSTKQTRSADEPTTVFAQCVGCKHRWTAN